MTKLLEEAINRLRQLPEAVQDEAAEILFVVASKRSEPVHVDDETRKAIREGKTQAGRGEFVSDEEMVAFFKRHGGSGSVIRFVRVPILRRSTSISNNDSLRWHTILTINYRAADRVADPFPVYGTGDGRAGSP